MQKPPDADTRRRAADTNGDNKMRHSRLILTSVIAWLGVCLGGCPFTPPQPTPTPPATTTLNCQDCHGDIVAKWSTSPHGVTQAHVAEELAGERAGQTPDEVIHGDDAENCIACHGPTAVLANGGMTEPQALDYFFTTAGGKFAATTAPKNDAEWPSIACTTCHDVPTDHPDTNPTLALFDSASSAYTTVGGASRLCGQCHGSLRFADTDHLSYDAWSSSKHADTQADVAEELGAERPGETPDEVISGDDPENCIACHGPTAVLANGGMTETQALAYFFTTSSGAFGAATAPAHEAEWPHVACTACHDPMAPQTPAYFNSATKSYETVAESSELCGMCHGNLRFAGTDHLSYNVETGTGGMGVDDQLTMPGVTCVDCHMFVSDIDGSNSAMLHGHTFAVNVDEAGGPVSACTQCHESIDADKAELIIGSWQASYSRLDAVAAANVEAAATAMEGVTDAALKAKLDEAQFNLFFAESDESGGVHNHKYTTALLEDANQKALEILAALGQ